MFDCSNLEQPKRTLEAMMKVAASVAPTLPTNVQSVLMQNVFKLYCSLVMQWARDLVENGYHHIEEDNGDESTSSQRELTVTFMDQWLALTQALLVDYSKFTHSADLEVQERVSFLFMCECNHCVNKSR